jgi:alpha-amylase
VIEGTQGDATLRSFMNWDDVKNNPDTQQTLAHWQKLGQFRKNHPAVGAGVNKEVSKNPYVCERSYTRGNYSDRVVIGLDLAKGAKQISVGTAFKTELLFATPIRENRDCGQWESEFGYGV